MFYNINLKIKKCYLKHWLNNFINILYMSNTYQIYLISDSTGETLDRIFTAIKAQFTNINYKIHTYSFTRTENQISKIISEAKKILPQ